jgi:hypothetical protein
MSPQEIELLGFYVSYLFAILATLGCPMGGYSYAINLGGALVLRKLGKSNNIAIRVCVGLALYLNLTVIATSPYFLGLVLSSSSIVVILERYVGIGAVSVVRILSS